MKNVNDYNYEVYHILDGECYDKDGNFVVMVGVGDDSGFWVENFEGEEIFIKGIYLPEKKFKELLKRIKK